jgi:hypothetical protein
VLRIPGIIRDSRIQCDVVWLVTALSTKGRGSETIAIARVVRSLTLKEEGLNERIQGPEAAISSLPRFCFVLNRMVMILMH